jgi:hypothetical protein
MHCTQKTLLQNIIQLHKSNKLTRGHRSIYQRCMWYTQKLHYLNMTQHCTMCIRMKLRQTMFRQNRLNSH